MPLYVKCTMLRQSHYTTREDTTKKNRAYVEIHSCVMGPINLTLLLTVNLLSQPRLRALFFSSLTPFIHLKSTQAVVIKVMLRVQPPILTHRIDHEKKWGRNIRMSWLDSIGKGIWVVVCVYLNVVRLKYLKIDVNLNIQRIQIFRTFGFGFNNRIIF